MGAVVHKSLLNHLVQGGGRQVEEGAGSTAKTCTYCNIQYASMNMAGMYVYANE